MRALTDLSHPLFCLFLLFITPSYAATFSAEDVRNAIKQYAPILKLHPDEKYFMDDPKSYLEDNPKHRQGISGAIIPDEGDFEAFENGTFYQQRADYKLMNSQIVSIGPSKNWPSIYTNKNFHYFLRFDPTTLNGDQKRASRIIAVKEHGQFLYLTFWFFYPYNGPGRALVGPIDIDNREEQKGRHYGDWEHVTIRVTKSGTSSLSLSGIYLSRHGFSPWYSDLSKFEKRDTHPIVYVAINSHAHYRQAQDRHIYDVRYVLAGLKIQTYDTTKDGGKEFNTSSTDRQIIVASNVSGIPVDNDAQGWWAFRQRWGQYIGNKTDFAYVDLSYFDKEVESAPTAPITKDPDEIHFIDSADAMAFGQSFNRSGALDVFAIADGFDGRCCNLQHNWLNDGTWHGWEENYKKAPRASSIVGGNFLNDAHFFLVGNDDHKVYHNWLHQSWQDTWNDVSFPDSGAVRFASFGVSTVQGAQHAEVFAVRDSDGAMLHTWTAAATGGWRPWAANFFGFPPGVTFIKTAIAFNTLVVVAIASDGNPMYAYCDNGFWTYAASIPNAPRLQSLTIAADNPLELLGVSQDQHLWHVTYQGGGVWGGWEPDFQNAPATVKTVSSIWDGNLEAFIVDGSGQVRHNWKSGTTWHSWDPFLDSIPKALRVSSGRQIGHTVETFAITEENSLAHAWLEGQWKGWQTMFFDASNND